jgi:hypothetical protein
VEVNFFNASRFFINNMNKTSVPGLLSVLMYFEIPSVRSAVEIASEKVISARHRDNNRMPESCADSRRVSEN